VLQEPLGLRTCLKVLDQVKKGLTVGVHREPWTMT
jgi:hypothetical protein